MWTRPYGEVAALIAILASLEPLKTESKIISLQSQGLTIEALVESIIQKARDKDGKPLFQDTDRVKLMNEADPGVIVKIASAINNAKLTTTQELLAKK